MAQFLMTMPQGQKFKVAGANQEGALQALQQHMGTVALASVLALSLSFKGGQGNG